MAVLGVSDAMVESGKDGTLNWLAGCEASGRELRITAGV
jgi:hypothetical protein